VAKPAEIVIFINFSAVASLRRGKARLKVFYFIKPNTHPFNRKKGQKSMRDAKLRGSVAELASEQNFQISSEKNEKGEGILKLSLPTRATP